MQKRPVVQHTTPLVLAAIASISLAACQTNAVQGDASVDGGLGALVEEAFHRLVLADCANDGYCAQGSSPERRRLRASVLAGRIRIDGAALEECLDAERFDDSDFGSVFDSRSATPVLPPCSRIWVPLTGIGSPCDTDFACIGGYCDRGPFTRIEPTAALQDCGICVARHSLGEPCGNHTYGWVGNDVECDDGLVCTNGICGRQEPTPLIPFGGACVAAEGRACSEGYCRTDGVCGWIEDNEGCSFDRECQPGRSCNEGRCGPTTLGGSCWPYRRPGDAECADGNVCFGTTPTCHSAVDAGEACENDMQCSQGLRCALDHASPTCVEDLALGDACTDSPTSSCQRSLACVDGTCRVSMPLADPGALCILPSSP